MSGQFLDKQSILFVESEIKNGRFGKLNSFFLFKDAKKIVESYYNGYNAHTLHEFQSVTKSLQSLLIGIAIDKGLITSLDTPIQIYFEDVKGVDWSNDKDKISIKDLLQMTAGLAWNESDTSYLSLNNHSNQLAWSNNWLEFALNRPMGYDSGKKFCYSSANPILLSAIVNKVYEPGQEKFIRQYLFKPLEISLFHYHRSLNDSNILADIDMLPKDMAKIALLVAQNGNWEGQQLVSTQWVQKMLQPVVNTGIEKKRYGYGWWYDTVSIFDKHYNFCYAWGYGSQHIFIVHELNMVMLCTGKNYEVTLHEGPFELLKKLIELTKEK